MSVNSLRVDNLPPSMGDDQLMALFGEIGPVRKAFVVRKEGKAAGYGIVVYALAADAAEAVAKLNRKSVEGRTLKLQLSRGKRKPGSADDGPGAKRARQAGRPPTKLTVAAIQLLARTVGVWTSGDSAAAEKWVAKCCASFAVETVAFPPPADGRHSTDTSTGHVVFATAADAKKATRKIDRQKLGGALILARRLASLARTPKALSECRVIVRNLGFSTTEAQIRAVFEKAGPLRDVVVPSAKGRGGGESETKKRGFAFVGYLFRSDAARAVKTLNEAQVDARSVAVDWAVHKTSFEAMQMQAKVEEVKRAAAEVKAVVPSQEGAAPAAAAAADDASGSEDSSDSSESEEEEEEEETEGAAPAAVEKDEAAAEATKEKRDDGRVDQAVQEERTLFVSNIPFTTTQSSLRACFGRFGPLAYVAMVKDRISGRSRGTAFVSFETNSGAAAAHRAMTLVVDGRELVVRRALPKGAAAQQTEKKKKRAGDKRNLYLLLEGAVQRDDDAAEGVSEKELEKRENALSNKRQKLKSPLFFIARNRLSVRNIGGKGQWSSVREGGATLGALFSDAARSAIAEGLLTADELDEFKECVVQRVVAFLLFAFLLLFAHQFFCLLQPGHWPRREAARRRTGGAKRRGGSSTASAKSARSLTATRRRTSK